MSTRSNIAVKVRPEDYAQVKEVTGYDMTNNTPYLQIYCHFNGYPSHMLYHELEPFFNNYESALKIVLGGDTSFIANGEQKTYVICGEKYEDNKPQMLSEPSRQNEYLYVFEGNRWKVY